MALKTFLKRKQINPLKKYKENTIKQMKDLNKMAQDLKIEIETIKKSQMEAILEMENLRKRPGTTDASNTNRIQ